VPDQISSQEQLAAHTQNIAGDIEQTTYRSPTGRDRQFDSRQFNEQAQRSQFSSLMNDDSTVASSAKMNFIQRDNLQSTQPAENSGKPEQQNLGQLISKLGMNLAFVLFLAIGGVLAAKQWIKPGSPAMRKTSTSAKTETPSMQIIDTLRIDSKTTLRLIECDDSRVLVATDAAGIKSVNLLTPSFDHALLNDVEAFEKTEPQRAVQSDSFEEGATPKRGPKHTSYAPTINKSKPTPTIYQPPRENATTSTHTSKESSDGMDEKLIRMLLENSKKRHVAK
jgi:flagellar biogenesis protein FliO